MAASLAECPIILGQDAIFLNRLVYWVRCRGFPAHCVDAMAFSINSQMFLAVGLGCEHFGPLFMLGLPDQPHCAPEVLGRGLLQFGFFIAASPAQEPRKIPACIGPLRTHAEFIRSQD